MIKTYLNILLVFFLIWTGCKDDDVDVTSPHYSYELLGTWEHIDSGQSSWSYIKFIIINSDNYYNFLISYTSNRHEAEDGVYSIIGNQINLDAFGIYNFTIKNDTLTLSSPNYILKFFRNNNAPARDEWLIPVNVIKEIPLTGMSYINDITFDGSFFWVTDNLMGVLKIDSLGTLVDTLRIYPNNGITFSSGNLWVSSSDTLYKINPLNGATIAMHDIGVNFSWIKSLASETGYIWVNSSGLFRKVNELTGVVADTVHFFGIGAEFQQGKIWTIDNQKIFSVDILTDIVINTYQIPNNSYGTRGLTFDGQYFWIITFSSGNNSSYLKKLDLHLY